MRNLDVSTINDRVHTKSPKCEQSGLVYFIEFLPFICVFFVIFLLNTMFFIYLAFAFRCCMISCLSSNMCFFIGGASSTGKLEIFKLVLCLYYITGEGNHILFFSVFHYVLLFTVLGWLSHIVLNLADRGLEWWSLFVGFIWSSFF